MNMMSNLISITKGTVLYFTAILWSEVSAQCSDPLIYKLDQILAKIQTLEDENRELRNNLSALTTDFNNYKSLNRGRNSIFITFEISVLYFWLGGI